MFERYLHEKSVVDPSSVGRRDGLRVSVVIPAKAERQNLPGVLDSLGPLPPWAEVIVVVNHGPGAPESVIADNHETAHWLRRQDQIVVVDRFSEGHEIREGGVGRARRVGMDTALARLHASGAEGGIIACLDADAPVDEGYLDALEAFFETHPDALAGVCHFEHQPAADPAVDRAIIEYEIWMRYWEEGLLWAGSPYAFQNMGSCMVASARGYAAVDGMVQLEAAQDFYFLEKVVKHGGPGAVKTIADAVVRPSARPSTRVPHGTGRALASILEGRAEKYRHVPPISAFDDLALFLSSVDALFLSNDALDQLAPELVDFIERRCRGRRIIDSMRENAPDEGRFARHFHAWFSASRQIQYANEVASARGKVDILDACHHLLGCDEHIRGDALLSLLRERAQMSSSRLL